jgi:hypothetical protein
VGHSCQVRCLDHLRLNAFVLTTCVAVDIRAVLLCISARCLPLFCTPCAVPSRCADWCRCASSAATSPRACPYVWSVCLAACSLFCVHQASSFALPPLLVRRHGVCTCPHRNVSDRAPVSSASVCTAGSLVGIPDGDVRAIVTAPCRAIAAPLWPPVTVNACCHRRGSWTSRAASHLP